VYTADPAHVGIHELALEVSNAWEMVMQNFPVKVNPPTQVPATSTAAAEDYFIDTETLSIMDLSVLGGRSPEMVWNETMTLDFNLLDSVRDDPNYEITYIMDGLEKVVTTVQCRDGVCEIGPAGFLPLSNFTWEVTMIVTDQTTGEVVKSTKQVKITTTRVVLTHQQKKQKEIDEFIQQSLAYITEQ